MAEDPNPRNWKSWVGFAAFVLPVGGWAVLFVGEQVHIAGRVVLTILFLAALITVGVGDWKKVPFFVNSTDRGAFDWWTVVHFLAGVTFGAFFLPLWWVLAVVLAWELFEAAVPGWGLNEPFVGRVVDVAVALLGWLIVTGVTALVIRGQLPLIMTPGSIACEFCVRS